MPTIYIECTSTYQTDLNTGIQRVVRNVVRHASAVAKPYGYSALPVTLDGGLLAARIEAVISEKRSPNSDISSAAGGRERSASRLINSLLRAAKYLYQKFLRLIVVLLPFDPVRRFAYGPVLRRRLSRWLWAPLFAMGIRFTPERRAKSIEADRGDILLLLDASWSTLDSWSAIRRFKRNGGHVVAMIHDLIPVDYPQDCLPEHVAVFKFWLRILVSVADAFVCNSRSVAQRLSHYLGAQSPANDIPVAHFHLGSELDLVGNNGVRPAFTGIFSEPRHAFIVVGTIEPRKNQAFVLDAFERLWRAEEKASLVVIGRRGWLSDKILDRITNHPEFGRQLFLIRDASDTELDYAYRNASALVTASKIEGFGLPVVEAFQHGLPVLCSDIPVFREIAEGKAEFFALDEPRHLADSLIKFMRANVVSPRKERVLQPWLTWRESTEQLFSILMTIFPPKNAGKLKTTGTP